MQICSQSRLSVMHRSNSDEIAKQASSLEIRRKTENRNKYNRNWSKKKAVRFTQRFVGNLCLSVTHTLNGDCYVWWCVYLSPLPCNDTATTVLHSTHEKRDNLLTAIGLLEYGRQRKNVQLQIVRRSCWTESRAMKITTCWMNELSLCTTVHGSTLPSSMLIETCWRSGSTTIQSDQSETEASYVNTDTEHTHTLNAHIDTVSICWMQWEIHEMAKFVQCLARTLEFSSYL